MGLTSSVDQTVLVDNTTQRLGQHAHTSQRVVIGVYVPVHPRIEVIIGADGRSGGRFSTEVLRDGLGSGNVPYELECGAEDIPISPVGEVSGVDDGRVERAGGVNGDLATAEGVLEGGLDGDGVGGVEREENLDLGYGGGVVRLGDHVKGALVACEDRRIRGGDVAFRGGVAILDS